MFLWFISLWFRVVSRFTIQKKWTINLWSCWPHFLCAGWYKPQCLVYIELDMEPRVSCMLASTLPTESLSWFLYLWFFFLIPGLAISQDPLIWYLWFLILLTVSHYCSSWPSLRTPLFFDFLSSYPLESFRDPLGLLKGSGHSSQRFLSKREWG